MTRSVVQLRETICMSRDRIRRNRESSEKLRADAVAEGHWMAVAGTTAKADALERLDDMLDDLEREETSESLRALAGAMLAELSKEKEQAGEMYEKVLRMGFSMDASIWNARKRVADLGLSELRRLV